MSDGVKKVCGRTYDESLVVVLKLVYATVSGHALAKIPFVVSRVAGVVVLLVQARNTVASMRDDILPTADMTHMN